MNPPKHPAHQAVGRARRVARMSLGEILSRSVAMGWHGLERVLPRLLQKSARSAAEQASWNLPAAENCFPRHPFFCLETNTSSSSLSQDFPTFFRGRGEEIARGADAILAGALHLFGEQVPVPQEEAHWHTDWQTGGKFHPATRDCIASAPGGPDAKRVWELNRMQFVVQLGQAYLLTRREVYAERAIQLMQSWMAANPPFHGIHWTEPLEPALRLLSWLFALRLLEGSHALTGEAVRGILASVVLQRDYIRRHLSTYSSPNTHLLGEGLALFVAGLALPELRGAARGARIGQRILEDELQRQVADDGSHREKSAYYHCYALEMYLLATILGRQHGVNFTTAWTGRVERMAEFLMRILRPDGGLPRFGDDDGGKTLRLCDQDYYRPCSLLAIAAVLFSRGDFKSVAGDLPEELFWMLGRDGVRRYAELAPAEPQPASGFRWFPDAETATLRSGWSADDTGLVCQGNPMGMLTAGHSHAAPLSFELFMGRQPVVVDPGAYSYAQPEWRAHFRSAQAHNSVSVDELQWAAPSGPFRWQGHESLKPAEMQESAKGASLSIAHPSGAYQHLRGFALATASELVVHDELRGAGRRRLTFRLQFAPGCTIRPRGQHEFEIGFPALTIRLTLEGFQRATCTVREGQTSPIAGWVSPGFNRKVPAPVLLIAEDADLPARRCMRFSRVFPSL